MKKHIVILMSILMLTLLSVGCSEEEKTYSFEDTLRNTKVSNFTSECGEYETIADIFDGFSEINKGDDCKTSVMLVDVGNRIEKLEEIDMIKDTLESENFDFEYDYSKSYNVITISCDFSFGSVGSIDPEYMVLFSMDDYGIVTPVWMITKSDQNTTLTKKPDEIIEKLCAELKMAKILADELF